MPPRIGITCSSAMGATQPIETVGRRYVDGVADAGGLPVVLPALHRSLAVEALADLEGLVLTGGGDVDPVRYGEDPAPECGPPDAARDAWELALVDAARSMDIPVLGICRGAQVINVAFGGTLVQHLAERGAGHDVVAQAAEEVHALTVEADSRLARVIGTAEVRVNTIHHQSVERVGFGLVRSAVADDGVIEAVEAPDELVLGVQWHPELLLDREPSRRLFAWVVGPDRFGD